MQVDEDRFEDWSEDWFHGLSEASAYAAGGTRIIGLLRPAKKLIRSKMSLFLPGRKLTRTRRF